jgi:hypothetical protein
LVIFTVRHQPQEIFGSSTFSFDFIDKAYDVGIFSIAAVRDDPGALCCGLLSTQVLSAICLFKL